MKKRFIFLFGLLILSQFVSSQNILNVESNPEFDKNIESYFPKQEKIIQQIEISSEKKAELSNEVKTKIEKNGQAKVMVWLNQNADIDKITKKLNNFELKHKYKSSNGFAGTITNEDFKILEKEKQVNYIVLDQQVEAHLTQSRALIHANTSEISYSLTGKDIGVCVIDTGINQSNPYLNVIGGYDFVNNDANPMDDHGHGTSVAGVIRSNHSINRGIATKSNLIAVKVLNNTGSGFTSTIAAGIDWCVTNKDIYNISIISMSLGTITNVYTPSTNPLTYEPSLINAYNNNIAVVASSGNAGSTTGISYPAVSPYVISVGATWDANHTANYTFTSGSFSCTDVAPHTDKVTCYSNRASFLNIMAPGSRITTNYIGGGFVISTGTSFAAPHVSGVIAQMLQRNKELTPYMIKSILTSNADSVTDTVTSSTYPRLNSLKSIRAVPYLTRIGNFTSNNVLNFLMHAPIDAGSTYVFALSFGNSPGVDWIDGRNVPMNFDDLLLLSINSPAAIGLSNTLGVLDSNGDANATLTIPYLPGIENVEVYGGFVAINQSGQLTTISNSVRL